MNLDEMTEFINIKNITKLIKDKQLDNKGFSLVEIMVVITFIAILAAIAVPAFIGYIEKARKIVCDANCAQLERMYVTYVTLENIDFSEAVFIQYMQEYGEDICPNGGDIGYWDGEVQCRFHARGDDSESESDGGDDGSVPFL